MNQIECEVLRTMATGPVDPGTEELALEVYRREQVERAFAALREGIKRIEAKRRGGK